MTAAVIALAAVVLGVLLVQRRNPRHLDPRARRFLVGWPQSITDVLPQAATPARVHGAGAVACPADAVMPPGGGVGGTP